ncbi:Hypothetical predicted protein [Paramuricea clavata]|uniref:Reverse transcriptase/retrotransposon-derived protein RNase H-like domain-containing protein n=1 Tax=Paramuricea clavata TaxID=317549 RepID=A0A6S7HNV3_PARCT|nr:Hypothetical predicted protein [Paramuricea clavata]
MTNFCCRFVKNYATLTQPLRELTKKDVPFLWTGKQERALEKLRDALTNASENAYSDSTKTTEVFTDASPVGVAAVLTQKEPNSDERKIVAYATSKPSARLERWSLHLQPYDVTIRYQPGTENPSDYLSRHPLRDVTPNSRQEKVAEEFVNFLAETSMLKAINLTDLRSATRHDATLQAIMKAVQTGKWHETSKDARINISDFQSFEKVRNELCTLPDLVLREHRIVIPEALREKVIDIAHKGHMGVVKTQAY